METVLAHCRHIFVGLETVLAALYFTGSLYLFQVPVAVKTLREGGGAASRRVRNYERERERFLAETELMKRLHHPHVVQLYGVCLEAAPFYLVQARSLSNIWWSQFQQK